MYCDTERLYKRHRDAGAGKGTLLLGKIILLFFVAYLREGLRGVGIPSGTAQQGSA